MERRKKYSIKGKRINFINTKAIELIKYREDDGDKGVLLIEAQIPSFKEIYLLDGEVKKEVPEWKELLDRRIDVFNFKEFKKWWLDNEKLALDATISFKSGRNETRQGFISREKISPSLILALNCSKSFNPN